MINITYNITICTIEVFIFFKLLVFIVLFVSMCKCFNNVLTIVLSVKTL